MFWFFFSCGIAIIWPFESIMNHNLFRVKNNRFSCNVIVMTWHISYQNSTMYPSHNIHPLAIVKVPMYCVYLWRHFSSTKPHHKWRHDKLQSGMRGWSQKTQAQGNMVTCKYLYIHWRSSLFPNLNRVSPSSNRRPSATLHIINPTNLCLPLLFLLLAFTINTVLALRCSSILSTCPTISEKSTCAQFYARNWYDWQHLVLGEMLN